MRTCSTQTAISWYPRCPILFPGLGCTPTRAWRIGSWALTLPSSLLSVYRERHVNLLLDCPFGSWLLSEARGGWQNCMRCSMWHTNVGGARAEWRVRFPHSSNLVRVSYGKGERFRTSQLADAPLQVGNASAHGADQRHHSRHCRQHGCRLAKGGKPSGRGGRCRGPGLNRWGGGKAPCRRLGGRRGRQTRKGYAVLVLVPVACEANVSPTLVLSLVGSWATQ